MMPIANLDCWSLRRALQRFEGSSGKQPMNARRARQRLAGTAAIALGCTHISTNYPDIDAGAQAGNAALNSGGQTNSGGGTPTTNAGTTGGVRSTGGVAATGGAHTGGLSGLGTGGAGTGGLATGGSSPNQTLVGGTSSASGGGAASGGSAGSSSTSCGACASGLTCQCCAGLPKCICTVECVSSDDECKSQGANDHCNARSGMQGMCAPGDYCTTS